MFCPSCVVILQCAIINYPSLPDSVKPGVVTGQALNDLLQHAQDNKYAIPAVNCVTSSSINACLEAARVADAPIMIQFSSGGSQFYAGKGLDNKDFQAAIAGAVSGAYHVRAMAEQYGVPVILHTDHCAKKLLPWLDGLLTASEKYFEAHGEPLFNQPSPEDAQFRATSTNLFHAKGEIPYFIWVLWGCRVCMLN